MSEFMTGQKYTALTGAAGGRVAAELSRRGWAASITPRGVERNDVLAQHLETKTVVAIQGQDDGRRHEIYALPPRMRSRPPRPMGCVALVQLAVDGAYPQVLRVSRNMIAAYVYLDHRLWLSEPKKTGQPRKDSSRRATKRDELVAYKNRWDRLLEPTDEVTFWLPDRLKNAMAERALPQATRPSSPKVRTSLTLQAPEVLVLPAPRATVVLIPADRNERLAACQTRSFRDGVVTSGGIQSLAVTLPVLTLRHPVADAAPRAATVQLLSLNRKVVTRLELPALGAALLRHPAAVSHC